MLGQIEARKVFYLNKHPKHMAGAKLSFKASVLSESTNRQIIYLAVVLPTMLGKQFPIDEQATLITGIRPKNHKRRKRRRVAKHNSNNRNNINDNLARIKARGSASNAALRAGGSVLQRALQSSRSTSALTHQQPDYHTSGAATATTTAIAATAVAVAAAAFAVAALDHTMW